MAICECDEDGFCHRYQREMRGRFREICRGINVDLGTAAAFREQWWREGGGAAKNGSARPAMAPIPLLIKTDQAPGDAVALTAAIYSLHRAHPGRYLTAVESLWPDVFLHNPDVVLHVALGGDESTTVLGMSRLHAHYPAIHQSNDRGIHFMQGWTEHLGNALGVQVPLLTNRPLIYFDTPAPPVEDFWLVCSGGKSDMTCKLWGRYQEVVDALAGEVRFVQVGEKASDHPPLRGVDNMVGKTTLRGLFDLTRRARGVLCGVSLLMHVAAALDKPAVVIAGGREPVSWNAYPRQQYVHTVGALPCQDMLGHVGHACWRSRVVPLGDNPTLDRNTCERPVDRVPECMRMISPATVVEMVARYDRHYVSLAGLPCEK